MLAALRHQSLHTLQAVPRLQLPVSKLNYQTCTEQQDRTQHFEPYLTNRKRRVPFLQARQTEPFSIPASDLRPRARDPGGRRESEYKSPLHSSPRISLKRNDLISIYFPFVRAWHTVTAASHQIVSPGHTRSACSRKLFGLSADVSQRQSEAAAETGRRSTFPGPVDKTASIHT